MSHESRSFGGARINKYGQSCRTALYKTRALFSTQIFPYKALDSNLKEIRVLEVAPGTGLNIVTCTLKHISLLDDQVPCYETISYCWGSTGAKNIIKLNGSLISVPSSSEAAVKRMRFSDKPRVLWIDAICIDQSSQSEKGKQVAFMSTIYSKGKQNLVCLGEDDAGSAERAAKSVLLLVSEMRAEIGDVEAVANTLVSRKLEGSTPIKEFKPDVDFSALERLFNLAWFTRLWVVQEVFLAPTNTCHWGEVQIDLHHILHAAMWLCYKDDYIPKSLRRITGWHCAVQICQILQDSHRNFNANRIEPRPFLSYMFMLQNFEKTEPRDSVFAILGLTNIDKFSKPADAALLKVDYTKPLSDVLRDATRYAICQSGGTLNLSMAEPACSDRLQVGEYFPSWVARIDLHRGPGALGMLQHFYQANKGLGSPNFLTDTTYGVDVLLTEGIVVDQVIYATPVFPGRLFTVEDFYKGLRRAKTMVVKHRGPAYQENLVQGFAPMAFAVTAGQTKRLTRAQPEYMVELSNFLAQLDTAEDTTDTFPPREKEALQRICESLHLHVTFLRQVFATSEGSMGLGPTLMQANDLVVVLRGGIRPFILRKIGEFYQHIGSAYVHGIMDGEAVESSKAKNEPEMLFPIR